MSTTDPNSVPHPEELLGAYALDILDEEEALQVEAHLEGCFQCRGSVAGLRATAALLGQVAIHRTPPASLQARVMGALPRTETGTAPPAGAVAGARPRSGFARKLVPLAAVVVAGLLAFNLVTNLLLSARLDQLQLENDTLTRLEKLAAEESQAIDSLHQLRPFASYWLADSPSRPMILVPPTKTGRAEGLLLATDDGRRAMLMVAGMRQLPEPMSYDVWFTRPDQKLWVGQVKVDSSGWGTVTLHPELPLFGFETVVLTADVGEAGGTVTEGMVLEGQILAQQLTK